MSPIGITFHTSGTALQRGFNRLDEAASEIAKASVTEGSDVRLRDQIKPVVESLAASADTKAAVKLLDAEDKMLGKIIDVLA